MTCLRAIVPTAILLAFVVGCKTSRPAPVGLVVLTPAGECARKGDDGNYARGTCHAPCAETYVEWSFWVTNYNVKSTLGLGEHSGTALIEYRYTIDRRYGPAKDAVERPWRTQNPRLFERMTSRPSRPINVALCAIKGEEPRLMYNHGRTIARRPSKTDAAWKQTIPLTRAEVISLGPTAAPLPTGHADMTSCLGAVRDGFCDATCGNCSYVLPSYATRAIPNAELTEQPTAFKVVEGNARTSVRYVGGRNRTALWKNRKRADNFTHCVAPAKTAQQARVPGAGQLSGRFGHNSNTDANAALIHFRACKGGARSAIKEYACAFCGNVRRIDQLLVQWPCIAETNTAMRKWPAFNGTHNVSDSSLGQPPARATADGKPPPPLCQGDAKRPVFGM